MKKLVLMVAVIAAMTMVSCTPKQANGNIGVADSTKVDTASVAVDSTACQTNVK